MATILAFGSTPFGDTPEPGGNVRQWQNGGTTRFQDKSQLGSGVGHVGSGANRDVEFSVITSVFGNMGYDIFRNSQNGGDYALLK